MEKINTEVMKLLNIHKVYTIDNFAEKYNKLGEIFNDNFIKIFGKPEKNELAKLYSFCLRKTMNFYFIKNFNEFCERENIISEKEKQSILDDTLYYACYTDECEETIRILLEVLGAEANKKNKITNLSPIDFIEFLFLSGNYRKERLLYMLKSNEKISVKPNEYYKKDINSYILYILEKNRNKFQNIELNSLNKINSNMNFSKDINFCTCFLI